MTLSSIWNRIGGRDLLWRITGDVKRFIDVNGQLRMNTFGHELLQTAVEKVAWE